MKIGTRSLLFGTHQFALHPIMVALGWRHCYGRLPRDPRIWVAFVVHDWGYWGKPNMDGWEGQLHPIGGAALMSRWFDGRGTPRMAGRWWRFTAGHSRYFARRLDLDVSPLMRADKMATALMPLPLLIALAWLSGEGREYVGFHRAAGFDVHDLPSWARSIKAHWREEYGGRAA